MGSHSQKSYQACRIQSPDGDLLLENQNIYSEHMHKMLNFQQNFQSVKILTLRFDKKTVAEVGNKSRTATQCLDVPSEIFEEIDIPFFSLCVVIFLVKIHIKCIAIFFKTKKEDLFNL